MKTFNSIKHQKHIKYEEEKIFLRHNQYKVYGKDNDNNWYIVSLNNTNGEFLIEDAELLKNPIFNVNGEPLNSDMSMHEFSR